MDITKETLSELLCNICEDYLSCSPVYLTHEGKAICGHCYDPKKSPPANRMLQYEALARYARFPCKYRDLGCKDTQPFCDSLQDKPHEMACEHRQYLCPLVNTDQCDWLGKRADLMEHCRKKHPDHLLENSSKLTHDISKNSIKNYLLNAFKMLFLLHTKVCITSGKIYHAVRLIGDPAKTIMFNYSLKIKRDSFEITRPGSVAPQGCLAIQEDISIALDINSLLHVLDGFNGTSFIVIVQQIEDKNMKCVNSNCNLKIVPVSKEESTENIRNWKCPRCSGGIRSCCFRSEGCKFTDYDYKAEKHECYFCSFQKACYVAGDNTTITDGLQKHYIAMHGDITHKTGTDFRVSQGWWKTEILSTDFGFMICEYLFEKTKFTFHVLSAVRSNHLKEYNCVVRISCPITKQFRIYTAKLSLSEFWDWQVEITDKQIRFYGKEFDISVEITKVNN